MDEDRYRQYFRESPVGIMVVDGRGKLVEVNASACAMTGYAADELLALSIADLIPPEGRGDGLPLFRQVVETGHAHGSRWCARKDGTRFLMAMDAAQLGDDRFVAYCRDTTVRARIEESLRHSQELFHTLVDNAQGVIFMIDRAGTFVLSEGKGLALLGLVPGEVVGRSALEMYADFPPILHGIERALAGHTERSTVDVGGTVFDAFYSPYRDADGAVAGMLGMAIDVTARARAERARRELADRAMKAQKLESLGLLAGGIAHDFNNLLASIVGNADLLLRELTPGGRAHQGARRVADAGARAAALCQQLLAYAGKGTLELRPVSVRDAVRELAPLLDVAVAKNVTLSWHLADELPLIDGDASQIQQVAMNMITNASEAIGDRTGTIRVDIGAREVAGDELGAYHFGGERAPGSYVVLQVADSGAGMAEHTAAKIFDPFFTTKFTGRGLGMATVLGVVQAHGGAIRVDSRPGRGTTMTVLFPARAAGAPQPEVAVAPAAESVTGTVLVVDDDAAVRATVAMMLGDSGFDVEVAADGVEALERLDHGANTIACVVLDMTMPKMSGADCLGEIRARAPALPVVLSSGYSEESVSDQVASDPHTGFVQKPYRIDALVGAIAAVMAANV